jgi:ribosomal protein L37AE/L43A
MNPLLHYLKYGMREGRVLPTQRQSTQAVKPKFKCPVCQNNIIEFQPLGSYYEDNWKKHAFPFGSDDFETLNSRQYSCPVCAASDRDRLYALYLPRVMDQGAPEREIQVLDVAPSLPLKNILLKSPRVKYLSADRHMKDVDLVVDITQMDPLRDDSCDFFICSHVLEHVWNDRKALSELFRVLKTGGSGILMVPINLRIDKIREDPTITDIGERWREFGQDDHVRLYSKSGFLERVYEAGFTVSQYGIDFFGRDVFFQHGISPQSILYVVTKDRHTHHASPPLAESIR